MQRIKPSSFVVAQQVRRANVRTFFGSSIYPEKFFLDVPPMYTRGTDFNPSNNKYIDDSKDIFKTTLPNGIRITTEESTIPISTIGIHIKAGSRYEDPSVAGITSFLEGAILKSTDNRPTLRLYGDMAKIGCEISAHATREGLYISAQLGSSNVNAALGALADIVKNPAFTFDEVTNEIKAYKEQNKTRNGQIDVLVNEAIHTAAFGRIGLGAPLYAHDSTLDSFDSVLLTQFHETFFTPDRISISAKGVNHDSFAALCEEMFDIDVPSDPAVDSIPTQYTPTDIRVTDRSYKGLTHIALGFNGTSWDSEECFAASVLQTLMGGGDSFSSGGPGKGLYSRLYTNVLNKHGWFESANTFNNLYSDAGLFGFYATVPPEAAGAAVDVLLNEARNMSKITDEEVSRAKNILKSNVYSYLDDHHSKVEESAKFLGMFNKALNKYDLPRQIDQVTTAQVKAIAQKMLSTPICVATYGDASTIPKEIKL